MLLFMLLVARVSHWLPPSDKSLCGEWHLGLGKSTQLQVTSQTALLTVIVHPD